jgi:NAD(P)H-hydrate epimerase
VRRDVLKNNLQFATHYTLKEKNGMPIAATTDVALTREECRRADQFAIDRLKIPGIVLMENAGRSCAEKLLALGADPGVVICCGGGNNGGDGFVMARHLYIAGIRVKILLFSPPEQYRNDARINLRIVEPLRIPIVQFDARWTTTKINQQLSRVGRHTNGWLVDAILGTGAIGDLREPLDRVVPMINQLPLKRLAIDIPTGMDCDTGDVCPTAVRADVTCTFIARKAGFANKNAASYLGHVSVIGIGAPAEIIPRPTT